MEMIVKRLHRDIFPHTDHGYTWIETLWYERDGERISPLIPAAGCTERLGHMPGGPIIADLEYERQRYAPDGERIVKSETIREGFYRVNSVSIVPA
jgi:hypothetical protein